MLMTHLWKPLSCLKQYQLSSGNQTEAQEKKNEDLGLGRS